ncbi:MAG TPA: universal stress protein [Nitrososphaeraceae archaeon]|jgi:CBS domain-containing protein/nucleotide-binding universal stress UspA family protein|nr:universal stress protein [Nitrososphaeraceae archaeon]
MSTPHVDDKTLSVETVMTPLPLETALALDNIIDLAKHMKDKGVGSVVVTEYIADSAGNKTGTTPVGIITERDIVRRVVAESKDPNSTIAYDIMSKPLISVGPEATIYDAALIMTKYSIRRLPIVRDKTLLGIITSSDLARRMYEENRSDPTLMAMSRFQEVEKLAEAKDKNQNVQEKTKPEHNSLNREQDIRTQERFLQSIPEFKRILVPYDASEMSDKALKYAIYLSKISNSHIFILNVIENYEDLKEVLPTTIRAEQEKKLERSNKNDSQGVDLKVTVEGALRKVIEEKIRLCQEAGLDTQITYEIHTGKAGDEIINLAGHEDFDLIVMASHRITSTLKSLGSTARKVMDNVKKPILLIHE